MSHSIALLALEASDGTVVLTSIVLVFAMLVALCLIITVEGKIFDSMNGKKNGSRPAPKAPAKPAAAPPAPRANIVKAAPAPAADGAVPAEIVAAIAAAVAALGDNLTICGIQRMPKRQPVLASRRGVWGDAGVVQNTTPFI